MKTLYVNGKTVWKWGRDGVPTWFESLVGPVKARECFTHGPAPNPVWLFAMQRVHGRKNVRAWGLQGDELRIDL